MDPAIGGISLIALVFGLVQFAKKFGLQGNACVALAMGLGMSFGAVYQLTFVYPVISQPVGIVIFSLAFGLSASGIYDFVKPKPEG